MMYTPKEKLPNDTTKPIYGEICVLCPENSIDQEMQIKYFKYFVHAHCLLFNNDLKFRSFADRNGKLCIHKVIGGVSQVLDLSKRCCHCNEKGATVKCCHKNCDKTFHRKCGILNQSLHQYFGKFKTFCKKHRLFQLFRKAIDRSVARKCVICTGNINLFDQFTAMKSPCCETWFHRSCIEKRAQKEREKLACPSCCTRLTFQDEMLQYGVDIHPLNLKTSLCSGINEKIIEINAQSQKQTNTSTPLDYSGNNGNKNVFGGGTLPKQEGLYILMQANYSDGSRSVLPTTVLNSGESAMVICDPTDKTSSAKRRSSKTLQGHKKAYSNFFCPVITTDFKAEHHIKNQIQNRFNVISPKVNLNISSPEGSDVNGTMEKNKCTSPKPSMIQCSVIVKPPNKLNTYSRQKNFMASSNQTEKEHTNAGVIRSNKIIFNEFQVLHPHKVARTETTASEVNKENCRVVKVTRECEDSLSPASSKQSEAGLSPSSSKQSEAGLSPASSKQSETEQLLVSRKQSQAGSSTHERSLHEKGLKKRSRNTPIMKYWLIYSLDERLYGRNLQWLPDKPAHFYLHWPRMNRNSIIPSIKELWDLFWDYAKIKNVPRSDKETEYDYLMKCKRNIRCAMNKDPSLGEVHEMEIKNIKEYYFVDLTVARTEMGLRNYDYASLMSHRFKGNEQLAVNLSASKNNPFSCFFPIKLEPRSEVPSNSNRKRKRSTASNSEDETPPKVKVVDSYAAQHLNDIICRLDNNIQPAVQIKCEDELMDLSNDSDRLQIMETAADSSSCDEAEVVNSPDDSNSEMEESNNGSEQSGGQPKIIYLKRKENQFDVNKLIRFMLTSLDNKTYDELQWIPDKPKHFKLYLPAVITEFIPKYWKIILDFFEVNAQEQTSPFQLTNYRDSIEKLIEDCELFSKVSETASASELYETVIEFKCADEINNFNWNEYF